MLIIRKAQMDALEEKLVQPRFEDWIIADLRANEEEWFQSRTEEEVRLFVRHGIDKARRLGERSPSGYATIIQLMVSYGAEFESDAANVWAAAVLERHARGEIRGDSIADEFLLAAERWATGTMSGQ